MARAVGGAAGKGGAAVEHAPVVEDEHLAGAQPALNAARAALEQITANDMKTLKSMQKPPEMVRRIFDGVCILLHHHVDTPQCVTSTKGRLMLQDSWQHGGKQLLSRMEA